MENITYDNGEVGDSVLIKFINTTNGREYWSAQERKAKYPDSWVETKIHELQRQLETDDKRVPKEMRNDSKSGNIFTVEFEVYKGQGAFDHANNQLVELGDKAYHFMKKSPKNPHDPNLDKIMEDDELLVPTASLKRLVRKAEITENILETFVNNSLNKGLMNSKNEIFDNVKRIDTTPKGVIEENNGKVAIFEVKVIY